MRIGYGAAVISNAAIWCISVLLAAVLLQGTLYFVPIVTALCLAGLVSVVIVAMADKSGKSKEWYEGE